MEKVQRNKLMLRWSIFSAALIAIFWGIWFLIAGSVPVAVSLQMSSAEAIFLPFAVSRWWDILIGPLWSVVVIQSVYTIPNNGQDEDGDDSPWYLLMGLSCGALCGLACASILALLCLSACVLLYFFAGVALPFGMDRPARVVLRIGLGFWLGFGLGLGLGVGIVFGAGFVLIGALGYAVKAFFPARLKVWLRGK